MQRDRELQRTWRMLVLHGQGSPMKPDVSRFGSRLAPSSVFSFFFDDILILALPGRCSGNLIQ